MKSRKSFSLLPLTLLAIVGFLGSASLLPAYEMKAGIQTWTLRNMDFDQVVDFCVQHKIKYVQMIGKHMDPAAPLSETKRKKAILAKHGINCYTFGVAATSMNQEENRKLFEFAKVMGIKLIVVEPKNMAEWDNLEALVKEFNIKLAIHNHGISSVYGNPETVMKVLDQRDRRIGVCLDVGHLTGAGFDAATVFHQYKGRVFDIHLKDKKVEKVDGKEKIQDVKIGTGQANYAALFNQLIRTRWKGVLAIETDNDSFAKEPSEYVDRAIKFVTEHQP